MDDKGNFGELTVCQDRQIKRWGSGCSPGPVSISGDSFAASPQLYNGPLTTVVSHAFECDLEEIPQMEALGKVLHASSLKCVTSSGSPRQDCPQVPPSFHTTPQELFWLLPAGHSVEEVLSPSQFLGCAQRVKCLFTYINCSPHHCLGGIISIVQKQS